MKISHFLNSILFFCMIFISFCVISQETQSKQIPKKIHYVWFGGDETDMVKRNIATWKKYMPDYKIKRWDETNCDVNENAYVQYYYKQKKWQYVSDWCRLKALYNEGGIYFDTDVVLNNRIDDLLVKSLVLAYETDNRLSAGIIAITKNHPFMTAIIEKYRHLTIKEILPSPDIWTAIYFSKDFDKTDSIVYPVNILMLDFGGPETRAYHLYADGNSNINGFGMWYLVFQKRFLNKYAYCLKNCVGDWAEYLVFSTDEDGYKVSPSFEGQNNGEYYRIKTNPYVKYELKQFGKTELLILTDRNNNQEWYSCLNKKCELKIKQKKVAF